MEKRQNIRCIIVTSGVAALIGGVIGAGVGRALIPPSQKQFYGFR